MKATVTVVIAVVVVIGAVLVARQRNPSDATPRQAQPAAATATSTSSGPTPHAASSPSPTQPRPRLDKQARTEMLGRIEAARRRAAGPGRPAETVEDQPLDESYIRERIQELVPQLTECYKNALRRAPGLQGEVMVDFSIVGDPDVGGLVGESKINHDESTLADAEMGECVQETMYAAQFVPPKEGGEVRVSFPFVFKSGKE